MSDIKEDVLIDEERQWEILRGSGNTCKILEHDLCLAEVLLLHARKIETRIGRDERWRKSLNRLIIISNR